MTVSGLEMLAMETRLAKYAYANPSGTRLLRTTGVMLSMVSPEKLCATMAVEDALVVLAIRRTTPGAVSCRFTLVISTSSGGLRLAAAASASLTQASFPRSRPRMNAGETVTSIERVAL